MLHQRPKTLGEKRLDTGFKSRGFDTKSLAPYPHSLQSRHLRGKMGSEGFALILMGYKYILI